MLRLFSRRERKGMRGKDGKVTTDAFTLIDEFGEMLYASANVHLYVKQANISLLVIHFPLLSMTDPMSPTKCLGITSDRNHFIIFS
jgi:hypothetical protein